MAIHKYGETTLGYDRLTHQELAKMFDTTPHRISALQKCVSGREKLPVGGHEKSPVVAMKIPHWWPPDLPTYTSSACLAWAG